MEIISINKKVKVWYDFSETSARLIIEDEGEGFKDLEKWNEDPHRKDHGPRGVEVQLT